MQVRRFNPFGQGLRNCLGQQLARMNVPTAVAMFVSNFKLELTPEVMLCFMLHTCASCSMSLLHVGMLFASSRLSACQHSSSSSPKLGFLPFNIIKIYGLGGNFKLLGGIRKFKAGLRGVQDAKKSIEELEILKGTLQPNNGIHMICRPRTCNEE